MIVYMDNSADHTSPTIRQSVRMEMEKREIQMVELKNIDKGESHIVISNDITPTKTMEDEIVETTETLPEPASAATTPTGDIALEVATPSENTNPQQQPATTTNDKSINI